MSNGTKRYASEEYVDIIKESIYSSELYESISDGVNETTLTVGENIAPGASIKIYGNNIHVKIFTKDYETDEYVLSEDYAFVDGNEIIAEKNKRYVISENANVEIIKSKSNAQLFKEIKDLKDQVNFNEDGKLEIDELIIKSTSGKKFKFTVDDNGYLSTEEITG